MRENVKISKIDEKRSKQLKKNLLLKNVVYLLYILDKCLKIKVHKMLECQTIIYIPTFMKILLFQAFCKQNIRLKLGNHNHTDADPRKYCAYRKACI